MCRWCVLAPLYTGYDSLLYAKLHLAALEGLLEVPVFCRESTQRNVISAQHLSLLATSCYLKIEKMMPGLVC